MASATVDSAAEILSNLNINAGDWPPNLVKNLHLLSPDQVLHVPKPVTFLETKFKYRTYTFKYTSVPIMYSVLLFWQIELAKMLLEMGQSHLFQHWAEPGVEDDQKKTFFAQVSVFFFKLWNFTVFYCDFNFLIIKIEFLFVLVNAIRL